MAHEDGGGEIYRADSPVQVEGEEAPDRVQKGPPPQPGNKADAVKKQPLPVQPPPVQALENGTLIKGKFKIVQKIGQGAFGETYVAESLTDSMQTVAIKIERSSGQAKRDVLRSEVIALKKLQGCPNVVRYLSSGRDETLGINFLVMERLGGDIAEIKKKTHKQTFEVATTIRLGLQMLESIQGVHEQHYIHRDIKPSNFVIGREHPEKVYLIDFGLARRYRSNGQIRAARQAAGFRGTARYASIHSHKQMELGRRDDLWCLFYVLVEFRSENGLPWRRHKEKNVIGEIKERYTNESLVQHLPIAFSMFMRHLFSLAYESEPDYYYLKSLLLSVAEEQNIDLTKPMEWQRPGFGQEPLAVPKKKEPTKPITPPINPLAPNDLDELPEPRALESVAKEEVREEREAANEPEKDKGWDAAGDMEEEGPNAPTPGGSGLIMSPPSPAHKSPRGAPAPVPAPIPEREREGSAAEPRPTTPSATIPAVSVPSVEKEPEVQHAKVGNNHGNGTFKEAKASNERNDEETSDTPPNQNMKDGGASPSEGKERQKCKECCTTM
eukprot:TRINITY_DN17571_c0_g2_i1.p1 TRINITY_DN17571_c0_g2~~TRINITY_DN17571_c0_g2_i1.p1  ORF type:complete len:576 (+),score=105.96 TRINITY_DN17571_c0_g2_i1:67-1728(+)